MGQISSSSKQFFQFSAISIAKGYKQEPIKERKTLGRWAYFNVHLLNNEILSRCTDVTTGCAQVLLVRDHHAVQVHTPCTDISDFNQKSVARQCCLKEGSLENASISIPEVLNPQAALDIHVKKHNVQVPYKPSNRICDDMVSNINCLYHFKTPLNNRITEGELGSREKKAQ